MACPGVSCTAAPHGCLSGGVAAREGDNSTLGIIAKPSREQALREKLFPMQEVLWVSKDMELSSLNLYFHVHLGWSKL